MRFRQLMPVNHHQIINSLSDSIIVLDLDFTIIFANKATEEILEEPSTALTGRKCFDVFHNRSSPCTSESLQGSTCFHREIVAKGLPFIQKHMHSLPNGKEKCFKIEATPIQDAQGKTTQILLVLKDATREKRLEWEARQSNFELERLFNNSPDLLTYINPSLQVVQVNRAMAALIGRPPDSLAGKNCISLWKDCLGADSSKGENLNQYPAKKVLTEDREYVSTRKAAGRTFEIKSVPVRDRNGMITGVLEIGRDITATRKMIQALKESEHKYSVLFNSLNDAAFLHDLEGRIIEVNLEAQRRLGYSREELLQMTPADIDSPGYKEKIPERLRKIMETGSLSFETVHISRDGLEIPTEISTNLAEINGEAVIFSLARDITKSKKALEEIQESNSRFQSFFENSPIPLLIADFSGAKHYLEQLQTDKNENFCLEDYLRLHDKQTNSCLQEIKILAINSAAVAMYKFRSKEDFFRKLSHFLGQIPLHRNPEGLVAISEGKTSFSHELISYTAEGERLYNIITWAVEPGYEGNYQRVILSILDITDRKIAEVGLRRDAERLSILSHIYQALLSGSSNEIARTTLQRLRCLISFDGAAVMLLHHDNLEIERLAMLSTIRTSIQDDKTLLLRSPELLNALKNEKVYYYINHNSTRKKQPSDCDLLDVLHKENINYFLSIPMPIQPGLTGTLIIFSREADTISTEEEKAAREIAYFLAAALQNAWLLEKITRDQKEMDGLHQRLAEAEESERRRLAQELHDEVGQNLTVLGLNLSILKNRLDCSQYREEEKIRLEDSLKLVEETTGQIRSIMTQLRPPVLDDYGLLASLKWLADKLNSRTSLQIRVEGEEPAPRLSPQCEIALFRIAQEGLTNAIKHAQAQKIEIALYNHKRHISLTISDNGKGFTLGEVVDQDRHNGLGLLSMEDRAGKCGGLLKINTGSTRGTEIYVEVPYD